MIFDSTDLNYNLWRSLPLAKALVPSYPAIQKQDLLKVEKNKVVSYFGIVKIQDLLGYLCNDL